MSLAERLTEDMKTAMKEKDKTRLSVIRMVRSHIRNVEIDEKKTLSDEEVLVVLNKELKQRRDSLDAFEKGGREDLVRDIQSEITVLMEYMPEQLSETEILQLVQQAMAQTNAQTKADMGKLMAVLMPMLKGKADGKVVNRIVSEILQN